MTMVMRVHVDHIDWSWQGKAVRLGVTRMGAGPTILMLPALSSISTRGEMRPLQERLDTYEKEAIQDALRHSRGRRMKAAKTLGMTRRIFNYRVKRYGIDWRSFRN